MLFVYIFGIFLVGVGGILPDPHGNLSQKDFLKQMRLDWFDVEAYPMVPLTERQRHWFHSLGYGEGFVKNHPKGRHGDGVHQNGWQPNCLRKDLRSLTPEETTKWHNAFHAMKETMVDDKSEYEIMVTYHMFVQAPAAHNGASFLPWHREYLLR